MFECFEIIKDLFVKDSSGKLVNLKGYRLDNVDKGYKTKANVLDLKKSIESKGFKNIPGLSESWFSKK